MEKPHKFPSTTHLAWLGEGKVRGDKVMSPPEAVVFLDRTLVIEEKMDGANLGISVGKDEQLQFQNRGNRLQDRLNGQWERLRNWAAIHHSVIQRHLAMGLILFGEWCYARHSVAYDRLPDWFLGFDVFDTTTQRFWSTRRRNELLAALNIQAVPTIAEGRFTLSQLSSFLELPGAYTSEQREGLYLRAEDADWLTARAKLVRPTFTQQIAEHWMSRPLEVNRLDSAARLYLNQ